MTLEHKGVLFPTPFETKGFDKINNVKISLLAEEMLWKFAPYYFNEKYNSDKVFLKNVFKDLKKQLPKELHTIDFPYALEPLFTQIIECQEKQKELNKQNKEQNKKIKEEQKEKYGYCIKDGKKIEVSNYVVEGSRWFFSRGPLRGHWVSSVKPEDVEINASKAPKCTVANHNWKNIELKDTDYIAKYNINIGFGEALVSKFVCYSLNSAKKQNDTQTKYEHAIELTKVWTSTLEQIIKDCENIDPLIRENACISYLLFTFGIRIGNEKKENNIRDNTFGASTLLKKHIKIKANNTLHLNFPGKDSVIFDGEKTNLDKQFINAISYFYNTSKTDKVFNKANSASVSAYLKNITNLDFVSPKLCRTVLANITLAKQLQGVSNWQKMSKKEFKNTLMQCCLEVTKTLNHKKTITAEKAKSVDKTIKEKLILEKEKLEKVKKSVDEKLKKLENDKKLGKQVKDKIKQQKERLAKAKQKYAETKETLEFKSESKESNLNTALASYSNPQLNYSLCKYANQDISIIYSKAQQAKFEWASQINKKFWKNY